MDKSHRSSISTDEGPSYLSHKLRLTLCRACMQGHTAAGV